MSSSHIKLCYEKKFKLSRWSFNKPQKTKDFLNNWILNRLKSLSWNKISKRTKKRSINSKGKRKCNRINFQWKRRKALKIILKLQNLSMFLTLIGIFHLKRKIHRNLSVNWSNSMIKLQFFRKKKRQISSEANHKIKDSILFQMCWKIGLKKTKAKRTPATFILKQYKTNQHKKRTINLKDKVKTTLTMSTFKISPNHLSKTTKIQVKIQIKWARKVVAWVSALNWTYPK